MIFLNCCNIMNFFKNTKQSLIVEYGLHAPSYNFFY